MIISFLTIAIIILLIAFLISKYNRFKEYSAEIAMHMSEVNTAKAKYLKIQKKAIGLAGKATKNEGDIYMNIKNAGGKISSETLLSLGTMYPELKDKFATAANLSEKMIDSYRNEQTALNNIITQYNKYVSIFPNNIAAFILGYRTMDLIGQDKLQEATKLEMEDEMDFSEFL